MVNLQKTIDKRKTFYNELKTKVALHEQALILDEQRLKIDQEVQKIIQNVSEGLFKQFHTQIDQIVNKCLRVVFGNIYRFSIRFEQKRSKVEASLVFSRQGHTLEDPANESGGGVLDVAAFALRLACLRMSPDKPAPVLILDEPYKMLSKEYAKNIPPLLEMLAKELEMQFIIVSHNKTLEMGNVIEIGGRDE